MGFLSFGFLNVFFGYLKDFLGLWGWFGAEIFWEMVEVVSWLRDVTFNREVIGRGGRRFDWRYKIKILVGLIIVGIWWGYVSR